MCGIAGIYSFKSHILQETTNRKLVEKMLESMSHRGPDARGILVDSLVTLGHNRLSIVDLRDCSNQPMTDKHGRTLVFNGEIYNYRELKETLKSKWNFQTQSDTEVILAAYDRWGVNCVRHFNGDWAFALFDPKNNSLFLSRDRFGVKPLYYSIKETNAGTKAIYFASETKGLLEIDVGRIVTKPTLTSFMQRGKIEFPEHTLHEEIKTLPPAHNMLIRENGKVEFMEYWSEADLFGYKVPSSFDEAVEIWKDLLFDAVRIRLSAEVKVAVSLSGGLDSSLLTAITNILSNNGVQTFTGVAPGYSSDESEYAKLVAKMYGTRHSDIVLNFDDFLPGIDDLVRAEDTPVAGVSPVARLTVLRTIGENVKVVLDGQGGDEILAGYGRFHNAYRKLRPEVALSMTSFSGDRTTSTLPLLSEFHANFVNNNSSRWSRIFGRRSVETPEFNPLFNRSSEPKCISKVDEVTALQYKALRGSGLLSLLHTEDRLTMSQSLEGRVPYLDHRLVEFCFSCPLEWRIHDLDKRLSREVASRYQLLPPEIYKRTDKKGFASPYSEMLRKEINKKKFKQIIDDAVDTRPFIFHREKLHFLLNEHSNNIDNANRIFRAVTILKWLDVNSLEID